MRTIQLFRFFVTRRLVPWLLAGAAIALVAAVILLPTYALTKEDKEQAARAVVGWIAENRSLPGWNETFQDSEKMASRKRFFVACDFLPESALISADPRVQRVSHAEFNLLFKEQSFKGESDYLLLELKEDAGNPFVIKASNSYDWFGGYGYRFVFRKKLWGLQANPLILWVA